MWEQIPSEQTGSLPDPFNDITCGGWEITEEPRGCLALWAVSLQGKVRTQFVPGLHTVSNNTSCFYNRLIFQFLQSCTECMNSWNSDEFPFIHIKIIFVLHSSRCGFGVASIIIILRALFGKRCPYLGRLCRSAAARVTWCGLSCGRVICWSERALAETAWRVSVMVQCTHKN